MSARRAAIPREKGAHIAYAEGLQLMGDPISMLDMARTHDSNDKRMSWPAQRRMYRLRHCPVPELLTLYKTQKIRVVAAGIPFLAGTLVLTVDGQQITKISGARRSRRQY